jgi:hypothetical protein
VGGKFRLRFFLVDVEFLYPGSRSARVRVSQEVQQPCDDRSPLGNPLFLIHPPLERFDELGEKLPPTERPFCDLAIHACRYDGQESERTLRYTFARATVIDAPVWV